MGESAQTFQEFLLYFFQVALVGVVLENAVLTKALGTNTTFLVIKRKKSILLFGAVLTAITVLSNIIVFFVSQVIPEGSSFNNGIPLLFILVLAIVYLIVLVVLKVFSKNKDNEIITMVHITAFNSIVFGAMLLSYSSGYTLAGYIAFGFGMGVGFMLATFLLNVSFGYLYSENIPKPFRGLPITLVYIGILSLAFYGLRGHNIV